MESRTKKIIAGGALVLAGFGAGAAIAATGSASAVTGAVSGSTSDTTDQPDPSKSVRSDEHLLTGTTLDKVTAAVEAAYPNAEIQRVESDSDGVYEGHIVTSDGQELIVQVGADFEVTGTDTMGGRGDGDGDGPGAGTTAPGAGVNS